MGTMRAFATAATIAGVLFAAATAQACDNRYLFTCETQPAAAKEQVNPPAAATAKVRRPLKLNKVYAGPRQRKHYRHRLRRADKPEATTAQPAKKQAIEQPKEQTPEPKSALNVPPNVPPTPAPAHETKLDPGAFADMNALIGDRLAPINAPPPAPAAATAAEPTDPTMQVRSQDEFNEIDRAAPPPKQAEVIPDPGVKPIEVASTPPAPAAPSETPWLRHILVGIGGLLTIGSAVRMLVG